MVDIITALSMHPQLTELSLSGINMGRDECTALSTLLRYTTSMLEKLTLYDSNVDDEGIEDLINVLVNINTLEAMNIGSNLSITTRGWKAVANLLEMPNSNLDTLHVVNNSNFGDAGARLFATALANNYTLRRLSLTECGITREGWAPFSKLLCDTSSVNNTYLSNHTLEEFGNRLQAVPGGVESGLNLNAFDNKDQVAVWKILMYHSHFDMEPFFEWEFKVLPLMVDWFVKATATAMISPGTFGRYSQKINKLRLAVTYDFIKEFPMLYIEHVTRQEIAEYTTMEGELQSGNIMEGEQQVKLEKIRQSKARAMRRLGIE